MKLPAVDLTDLVRPTPSFAFLDLDAELALRERVPLSEKKRRREALRLGGGKKGCALGVMGGLEGPRRE